jgi:hypothetical protein
MFLVFTVPCSHCRKRCYDGNSRRHGSINEACHCGRSHRERRIIMIKTKEFVHYNGFGDKQSPSLEKQINEFIKGKELIDIKYQVTEDEDFSSHYALVIYKDGDK